MEFQVKYSSIQLLIDWGSTTASQQSLKTHSKQKGPVVHCLPQAQTEQGDMHVQMPHASLLAIVFFSLPISLTYFSVHWKQPSKAFALISPHPWHWLVLTINWFSQSCHLHTSRLGHITEVGMMVHISNPSPQEAEVKGSCTQGQSGYIVRTCVIHVYVCVCLNWAFRERSRCGGLGERRGSGVWIVSGQELKWKNLVTVTACSGTGIEVLLPCGSVCLVSPSERHASPSRKCLCEIGRTPVFLQGESSLRS